MDKLKKQRSYAPISLNPIFNIDLFASSRKSMPLPRIDNPSLRQTVTSCLGKGKSERVKERISHGKTNIDPSRRVQSKKIRLSSLITRELIYEKRSRKSQKGEFDFNVFRYMSIG